MKPTLCGKCRHDLQGLPGRGKCPQCGQRYWIARGQGLYQEPSSMTKGDQLVTRIKTLTFSIAGGLILLTGLIFHFLLHYRGALSMGLTIGGLLLLFGFLNYMQMREDRK